MAPNVKKLSDLGKKRFPTNAEWLRIQSQRSSIAVRRMTSYLSDNYPGTEYGRVASLFRVFSEEKEKALKSLFDIGDDQFYNNTRAEYLFQVLGDMLFINEKAAGVNYTDKVYREFLLRVKEAYLGGSTVENIGSALSDLIGIPVNIKELYLEARKGSAGITIKDTHRLLVDIYMSEASTDQLKKMGLIIQDLYYFIFLIKPAHTLFDTRLIWEETMGVVGCTNESFASDINGNTTRYDLTPTDKEIYQLKKLVVTTDPGNSQIVEEDWLEGDIISINSEQGYIVLDDTSELVVSSLSLFYQDFTDGEHRIDLSDLLVGSRVWFKGSLVEGYFKFYNIPSQVEENWYSQFDPIVIGTPYFQGNVKKILNEGGFPSITKGCAHNLSLQERERTLLPFYEDIRDNCDFPIPKIYHDEYFTPSTATDLIPSDNTQDLTGYVEIGDTDVFIQLTRNPIVNEYGLPASAQDITIYIDGKRTEDGIESVDATLGRVYLNFIPPAGSKVRVDYFFHDVYPWLVEQDFPARGGEGLPPFDGNNLPSYVSVQGTESGPVIFFQWPFTPTQDELYGDSSSYQLTKYPILQENGDLASKEHVKVFVEGIEIEDGVDYIRSLLGHIQLNFIAPLGSEVSFEYYYQSAKRTYPMVWDSDQHLLDTSYGINSSFSLVMDTAPYEGAGKMLDKYTYPALIGYRYRAFDLGHTSVLNSADTFEANDFQVPSLYASLATNPSLVSQHRLIFSKEYLQDTDKYVELNDEYLLKDLDPLVKLRVGTPPFHRSWTSFGLFNFYQNVESTDSTQAEGGGLFDIAAKVEVSNRPSGLVEYIPLEDYFVKGRHKVFSDLKEVTIVDGDLDIPLSTLCDDRHLALDLFYNDEYYPNREFRLNNYKDYIEVLSSAAFNDSTKIRSLRGIQGSNLLKSINENWSSLKKGSVLSIEGQEYTITSVLNDETIRVSPVFSLPSGRYTYTAELKYVEKVDTLLREVTRVKYVNIKELFPFYSTGFNSDYSPWEFKTYFPDPDRDPFPRTGTGGVTNLPPLLNSEITDQGSREEFLQTEEEADKLVKFRNWDQELFVTSLGLLQEPFLEAMDDTAESIQVLYWNVTDQEFEEYSFQGMILETSEDLGVVNAVDYPDALIKLSGPSDTEGLNDAQYRLKNTVIRQVLPDNTVDILTLETFERIP